MTEGQGDSLQRALERIRARSGSEAEKGRLFERLSLAFLRADHLYSKRFKRVLRWSEWAVEQGEAARDLGIDLVGEEEEGGVCAIQCKFRDPNTYLAKPAIDSFLAESNREPFTARLWIDTGLHWNDNARASLNGAAPPCTVLGPPDLAGSAVDWPNLAREEPEALRARTADPLRTHQKQAVSAVLAGLGQGDRGQLVMACGTGKTYTALRIAERLAGLGGRVLYLVPSISLLGQAMREWAERKSIPHRYVGVCSDSRAGRRSEDASVSELEIPVTTDKDKIAAVLRGDRPDAMLAVFCTYQSLPKLAAAQGGEAAEFDLVLCDEAHRTTGVERDGEFGSAFVLVHDEKAVRGRKRLYMTATPRLYAEAAKRKAKESFAAVFSMDDESRYGPVLHRLPFSEAVEQGLLTDYKVVVFGIREEDGGPLLRSLLKRGVSDLSLADATKIVGCWQALRNPEILAGRSAKPLRRAIAFANVIVSSKRMEKYWADVVEDAIDELPEEDQDGALRCDVRHVDGSQHALQRKASLEWLREGGTDSCRVLSNARCLSEGIDVPALDAVLFLSPRNSHVDIVQAVGRVMRKAKGKDWGYIVLPVPVPPGVEPDRALDDNERFQPVWGVLRALRSHDERLDAAINRIDLTGKSPNQVITPGGGNGDDRRRGPELLPFAPMEIPAAALRAKIVEKCGDRRYWESWARSIADIFRRLTTRVDGLLGEGRQDWFESFLADLQATINPTITREAAVAMIAQHVLTGPVFEALFEDYDFAAGNPVARALNHVENSCGEFGLRSETRDLEPFYASVRRRAAGLDSPEARQTVLLELYQKFFAEAMRMDAERLGIVYTPVEVVDFILRSANHVVRDQFGLSLGSEDVHVLDPFAGTGVFLSRLLQGNLIADADLDRAYAREMHANEIVLLAYYIAAISVEEARRARRGPKYEPFPGMVLTDTFALRGKREGFPWNYLPENDDRARRQQDLPIQVIVGNPPYSAGQKSSADDNPNARYRDLEERIRQTYARRSRARLKRGLYDTYKMAFRWASDRIGKQGAIAFVSNGSWLDGNVDSGLRACLADEFSSIYVLNLRGNARTSGDLRRREGDNVFGQGSRAPVAITVLVKNPDSKRKAPRILYHDIGDYLTREQKLEFLRRAGSIAGVGEWQEIRPDSHHDWLRQRDMAYQHLYPLGATEVKAGRSTKAVFKLFSSGYKTSRDAYLYNFTRGTCIHNARLAARDYMAAIADMALHGDSAVATSDHCANLRWDANLLANLERGRHLEFSADLVRKTSYRPFVKQDLYVEYTLANSKYQMDRIFPPPPHPLAEGNMAICVPGKGASKPFSVLVVNSMPDLELISKSQCFPLYEYPRRNGPQGALDGLEPGSERTDNITDSALDEFRTRYGDNSIDKYAIFEYVYGVLHAQDWRERFANDLSKGLPRIPLAPDFTAFAIAGRKLMSLHLGYETCAEHALRVEARVGWEWTRAIDERMRWIDKQGQTALRVNDRVVLRDIPAAAREYEVNGRTPLDWFVDRYKITTDRRSGIGNNPNGWFATAGELVAAIRRIVHVSVESARIVKALPSALED